MNASRTARERVRAELTREITDVARGQLATEGAGGLSLRAVAREMGMVSSAIYRYFPSRDDLLTALIVDGYNAIGEVAERADAACPAGEHAGRWLAVWRGDLANPAFPCAADRQERPRLMQPRRRGFLRARACPTSWARRWFFVRYSMRPPSTWRSTATANAPQVIRSSSDDTRANGL